MNTLFSENITYPMNNSPRHTVPEMLCWHMSIQKDTQYMHPRSRLNKIL